MQPQPEVLEPTPEMPAEVSSSASVSEPSGETALESKAEPSASTPEPDADDDVDDAVVADRAAVAKAPRRRRRGAVVAIAGAIMIGGMAIAIVEAVSPTAPSSAEAAREVVAPAPAPLPAAEPEPTVPAPQTLRIRAIAVLREQLASRSDRIRRIAALALARIQDPDAIAALDDLLTSESSELRRIEVAFGLARTGSERGREALLAALKSRRRDARLDAASALARLGDDAGRRYLHSMLSLKSHRLGAAAVLAELGDERGIELLTEVAKDDDEPEAARLRATVALGHAGRGDARDALRKIMDDGRFQVGAAAALAELGDASVVPALANQLRHSSVRVEAATAIARLGADVDLEPLALALDSGDEVAAVSAAESILILVGPRSEEHR